MRQMGVVGRGRASRVCARTAKRAREDEEGGDDAEYNIAWGDAPGASNSGAFSIARFLIYFHHIRRYYLRMRNRG